MTEKSADKQRSAFRFDRRFLQGLIIGVLAAVIIGLGITAIAKPEVFVVRRSE